MDLSSNELTPAHYSFRTYLEQLELIITDPGHIATALYSRGLIDRATKQRASLESKTQIECSRKLLEELETKIEADDKVFDKFVAILENLPPMNDICKILKATRDEAVCLRDQRKLSVALNKSVIEERIRTLKKRFLYLKNKARDTLEMKKVAVQLVADILTTLSPDEDKHHRLFLESHIEALASAKLHAEIFVTMNFHWNYLDPCLLDHLVDNLELEEMKEEMEKYKIELQKFRESTPLFLFCQTQKTKKIRLAPDFQELVAEFDWDQKVMLQYVEDFRQKFASHYDVHEFAMMIAEVRPGSFIITWFIPACIVGKLQAIENVPQNILKEHFVSQLHVGGILVYQKVTIEKPTIAGDIDRHVPEEKYKIIKEKYICPVMLTPLFEPYLTSCCGKHLSSKAVARIQDANGRCPLCKNFWVAMLDKKFQRKVKSCEVRCCHDNGECPWKGELSSFNDHVKSHHVEITPIDDASSCITNPGKDMQFVENRMTEEKKSFKKSPGPPEISMDGYTADQSVLETRWQHDASSPPPVPWQPPDTLLSPPAPLCKPSYANVLTKYIDSQGPRPLRQTIPVPLPPPLQPRKALPPPQFMRGSQATSQQQQPNSISKVYMQPLVVSNYHRKFRELLKLEEIAHSKLLEQRCDGNYCVILYQAGEGPKEIMDKEAHARFGHITGIDCDVVSYATQSADSATIDGTIKCDILHYNMFHAENLLYFGLWKENVKAFFSSLELTGEQDVQSQPVPIHFKVKYRYFKNLKQSIWMLDKSIILRILPTLESFKLPPNKVDSATLNSYTAHCSTDQSMALEVIVSAPPSGPPVLISGPFGTGKTHILAIAAHYFLRDKNTAILVCTQQHNSADAYLAMYEHHKLTEEQTDIIRLLPNPKRKYKHYEMYIEQFKNEFHHYKHCLIVTTCLTAKRMSEFIRPGFFTHIFLDEGAQMREPEAVAPLCMANTNTKIVIAGDKFQVGPAMLVLGEEPQKYGLAVSLLERLYNLYQEMGGMAQSYCVQLSTNFRCHQGILNLAHHMAYTKTPLLCSNDDQLGSPFPLRFVCTSLDSKIMETKESICKIEVEAALKEASDYLMEWSFSSLGVHSPASLCFLSPCRGQVTVARDLMLGNFSYEVKFIKKLVTYQTQGNEFRALFISTSEPTHPNSETKDPTKSISDPSVFITAITRAASMVVAVGNPFMLLKREEHMVKKFGDSGRCWSLFLKACFDNDTVSIYPGIPNDDSDALLKLEKRIAHLVPSEVSMKLVASTPVISTPIVSETTSPKPVFDKAEFLKFQCQEVSQRSQYEVECWMQYGGYKSCALKMALLCGREEEEEMLMALVNILVKLEHPSIVHYDEFRVNDLLDWHRISPGQQLSSYKSKYDSEVAKAAPESLCIQTELCEAETLEKWMRRNKYRKRNDVIAWFKQLLQGVEYMHNKGIIHRGIRPANILLSREEDEIRIKISGFSQTSQGDCGISASAEKDVDFYASPEQKKKKKYGEKIDIYALGITYFEMNCPFDSDKERFKILTDLCQDRKFPPHFDECKESEIIQLMLKEDPNERPSAKELLSNAGLKKMQRNAKKNTKRNAKRKKAATLCS